MKGIILTGVGFLVGVAEALVYYNLGQSQNSRFKFKIPPTGDLVKTVSVVLVTSLITTALFSGIELMIDVREKKTN